MIEVIRDPHDKPESKYNPDAGMSKEDEDKYKRLIDENKQLAAKIKEVPIQILQLILIQPRLKKYTCIYMICILINISKIKL